jgi:rhodanese-related sulfurtransferase
MPGASHDHAPAISAGQLTALMASMDPHAVLDLRERGAYERGHIFRATSLPRRLLEFRLPALVTARRTPIVLYDGDGSLSELARPALADMGYEDARVLAGGLTAWRASGRPVVEGVNVPSKVFGERTLHALETPQISAGELQARLRRGDEPLIVDARTPEEYARGCVPGAWSVPGGELVLRIADMIPSRDTAIVVHCGGRTRSYIGAESLRRMGLPNPLFALENGTMGWELAGLTLERGATRWAPPVSERSRALAEAVAGRTAAEDGVVLLSVDELRHLWTTRERENVYILDVRSQGEYEAGHVPGSIWAPGGQAVQAADDYIAVNAGTIVFVCDGSVRSAMTAGWFKRMNFPKVFALAGGLAAWVNAGGTIELGHPAPLPAGHEPARLRLHMLTPTALRDHLDGGMTALVLDVDQSDVYARGHVPGAAWLCRSRLERRVEAVAPDRRAPIVVTCGDGRASTLAGQTLDRLGYTAIRVLAGGSRAWEQAGLPMERGPTRLLDQVDDVVLKPYERGRAAMEAYLRWETAIGPDGRSPYHLLTARPEAGSGADRDCL